VPAATGAVELFPRSTPKLLAPFLTRTEGQQQLDANQFTHAQILLSLAAAKKKVPMGGVVATGAGVRRGVEV